MKIFWPGDRVGAVAVARRAGLDEAEIGAAMRLGQVHRAGPFAGRQFRQVGLLDLVVGVNQQRRRRAVGQAGIHGEGLVGRDRVFARERRRGNAAGPGRRIPARPEIPTQPPSTKAL